MVKDTTFFRTGQTIGPAEGSHFDKSHILCNLADMKKAFFWIIGILAALCIALWCIWEDGTVEDTQYSNVYDQTALTLRLRSWNNYETTHQFSL